MLSRSLALMMPLLLAPVAVACSVETASDEEAAEEALTRGTTIPEGSYLARGVLRVANELSAAQLRAAPLKVSATLTAAIVSRRGTAGFPTLAALDAISGTGPAFFDKLTAYAKANGYVGRCVTHQRHRGANRARLWQATPLQNPGGRPAIGNHGEEVAEI